MAVVMLGGEEEQKKKMSAEPVSDRSRPKLVPRVVKKPTSAKRRRTRRELQRGTIRRSACSEDRRGRSKPPARWYEATTTNGAEVSGVWRNWISVTGGRKVTGVGTNTKGFRRQDVVKMGRKWYNFYSCMSSKDNISKLEAERF